uniref:Uncharacterized protein n=1 Tax=Solanum lycopersicum TaxID=4081 RepID=A0A3Q7FIT9_SOLLC
MFSSHFGFRSKVERFGVICGADFICELFVIRFTQDHLINLVLVHLKRCDISIPYHYLASFLVY